MVCDAMHAMDETMKENEHPGHSLQSIKKYMGDHFELAHGWEKRLNNTIKIMIHKKQLVHAAGHMGSFRLSKSMAAKEGKRLMRINARAAKAKAEAVPVKKQGKRKAAKMEGPAKRAKKAAPKKTPAKAVVQA